MAPAWGGCWFNHRAAVRSLACPMVGQRLAFHLEVEDGELVDPQIGGQKLIEVGPCKGTIRHETEDLYSSISWHSSSTLRFGLTR